MLMPVPPDLEQRAMRPTGRRAGKSRTRDDILDAALELFAEHGYDGTSLRAVAASAGVDHGLIRHFYGDKAQLFASTIADRTVILERLAGALTGGPDGIGLRVTDTYLRMWEEPGTRPILLALVRSATNSPRAANLLEDIFGTRIRAQNPSADRDDAQMQRVAIAGSHLMGLAFARHIVKLQPIADANLDDLVAAVAPTIQRYLTGNHL